MRRAGTSRSFKPQRQWDDRPLPFARDIPGLSMDKPESQEMP